MPEFRKVDHAVASPTTCVGCGTHAGPFIDLGIALPVYGALYLCVETESRVGCAGQIAKLNGGLTRNQAHALNEQLESADAERIRLGEELRRTMETKVIKVSDLFNMGTAESMLSTTANAGTVTFTLPRKEE